MAIIYLLSFYYFFGFYLFFFFLTVVGDVSLILENCEREEIAEIVISKEMQLKIKEKIFS